MPVRVVQRSLRSFLGLDLGAHGRPARTVDAAGDGFAKPCFVLRGCKQSV
jgi:hypothetical protein